MLEKLEFITPTLMTVLDLFFTDPMQEYHEREVVRKTGVSLGSANKMLRLLAENGFLLRKRRGKMVFYRLADQPTVRQFKVLVNVYALKTLVDSIRDYCRKIVLFGSAAQGTDVKESDIDLFILSEDQHRVRKSISEFNSKNKKKVAPIIVDATGFIKIKREDKPLYENIDRGIVLWQAE